jgi:carbohydrate kinase (thermoresistant glucokinase family)
MSGPIIAVMGVSGSGKTTIGLLLASALGCAFQDGDALHPPANIGKMRHGIALTDADRGPWLRRIADEIDAWHRHGQSGILACSALKRAYRDTIIGPRYWVTLIYLKASRDLVHRRMIARHEHFMPVALLDSQFSTLEEPAPEERAITVDVDQKPADIVRSIVKTLEHTS